MTLEDLPPELHDSWITPDGRARVQVFPKGDARDHKALTTICGGRAHGRARSDRHAGDDPGSRSPHQFGVYRGGVIAVAAITLLLAIVLRRLRDVALVLGPLLFAAVLTLAITIVIGKPLNYANIIALPLLFGIGVAFNIYFVMNWRAGITDHLQSSTARAVVFSALTTMAAFGSLAYRQIRAPPIWACCLPSRSAARCCARCWCCRPCWVRLRWRSPDGGEWRSGNRLSAANRRRRALAEPEPPR